MVCLTENGLLFKLLPSLDLKSPKDIVRQFRSLSTHLLSCSVDIREDPVRDTATVGVPRQSVFGPTLSLVTGLSVNQQDGEIYDIEVRQNM